MLPFLAKKNESANTGLIVKTRTPDQPQSEDQDDPSAAKEACGQAIISAIQAGDAMGLADAMQDMYDMCQGGSEPEENSFDAQNIQAGQE